MLKRIALFCLMLGALVASTQFMPISAAFDENVLEVSESTEWITEEDRAMTAEEMTLVGISNDDVMKLRSGEYRTRLLTMDVSDAYKPKLAIYYKTMWVGTALVREVYRITLLETSNGLSYSFNGTIYANLESSRYLYLSVNGKFYRNTTTTYNQGFSLQIGGFVNINFSASSTSNFYRGYSRYGRIDMAPTRPPSCSGNICTWSVLPTVPN